VGDRRREASFADFVLPLLVGCSRAVDFFLGKNLGYEEEGSEGEFDEEDDYDVGAHLSLSLSSAGSVEEDERWERRDLIRLGT